jgi:prepilin-type N-terminal cleavage/methylation domain-containing protein
MRLKHSQRGFTLTEMAIVIAIIGLLVGGAMMTLSAQLEQRNHDETMRRLNAAVDALIAFAVVNRRLPCPAAGGATGDEAPAGGGTCTTNFGGFVPGRTIGIQPVDSAGYAVDVWGNRIRYAVASAIVGCTGPSSTPHFTSTANLKTNGVSCRPNDLDVCAPVDTSTTCTAANRVASTQTIAFLVFSSGKNGAVSSSHGPHETANLDGNAAFISRTPSGPDSAAGTFDDLMVFVPAGVFYSRVIAAGALP